MGSVRLSLESGDESSKNTDRSKTGSLSFTVVMGVILVLADVYAASYYGAWGLAVKQFTPPYPPSPVIERIDWDLTGLRREAPGSDIWATTWGDGGGFGGTNVKGRVSMGVARIEGAAEDWKGFNVWGGRDPESDEKPFRGKAIEMLSIAGTLYMSVSKQDVWTVAKIAKSTDHGQTWISGDWDFGPPADGPSFLNFGKDYEGARDQFVYSYMPDGENKKDLLLARVPKTEIMNRSAYEFFAGLDEVGQPFWESDMERRRPVFSDPNGVGWGIRAVYNPGLHRYLLSMLHALGDGDGSWGLFDAPEPWGPGTTVAYYTN